MIIPGFVAKPEKPSVSYFYKSAYICAFVLWDYVYLIQNKDEENKIHYSPGFAGFCFVLLGHRIYFFGAQGFSPCTVE